MTEIYKSPTYELELTSQTDGDLVTIEFLVTYPQALRPTKVRKAQFTLPWFAIQKIASELRNIPE